MEEIRELLDKIRGSDDATKKMSRVYIFGKLLMVVKTAKKDKTARSDPPLPLDFEDVHLERDDVLSDGQIEVFTATSGNTPTHNLHRFTIIRGTNQQQESRLSAENNGGLLIDRISPGHTNKPLYLDSNFLVLESQPGYKELWSEISESRVDKVAIQQLALVLGQIHRKSATSDLTILSPGAADLTEHQRVSMFQQPYVPTGNPDNMPQHIESTLIQLHADLGAKAAVDRLSSIFTDTKESFVHGDLSLRNVIVKSGHPKLVNLCYCMAGPRALDLGILLASYMALYHIHMLNSVNNDAHRRVAYKMMDACTTTMDTYLDEMKSVLSKEDTDLLLSHVAGFAACELIRRSVGSDPYPGLVHNPSATCEIYESGMRLIRKYESIRDMGRLMMIGLQLC